jgi:hypothetical protein
MTAIFHNTTAAAEAVITEERSSSRKWATEAAAAAATRARTVKLCAVHNCRAAVVQVEEAIVEPVVAPGPTMNDTAALAPMLAEFNSHIRVPPRKKRTFTPLGAPVAPVEKLARRFAAVRDAPPSVPDSEVGLDSPHAVLHATAVGGETREARSAAPLRAWTCALGGGQPRPGSVAQWLSDQWPEAGQVAQWP